MSRLWPYLTAILSNIKDRYTTTIYVIRNICSQMKNGMNKNVIYGSIISKIVTLSSTQLANTQVSFAVKQVSIYVNLIIKRPKSR